MPTNKEISKEKVGDQMISKRKQAEEAHDFELFKAMTNMFAALDIIYFTMELTYDESGKPVDGIFIEANSAAERLLGKSREQIIGKSRKELFGNFFDELPEKFGKVVRTGKPAHFEGYSGPLNKYYDIYAWEVAENQVSAIIRDLTESKKAEETQKENEERLQQALDAGEFGLWGLNVITGKAWRTLRHDQIFGYNESLPEWTYQMFLSHVLPEDRTMVDEKFGGAIKKGTEWNFECRIKRPNGEERWIWAQGIPKFNKKHTVVQLVGLVKDITERKKAEEALHLSEERFRIGLKNAPVSVAAQDTSLRYVWAYNQKTALPNEIIDKLDKEIFTPQEAAHLDVIKRRVLEQGVELREQQWYNRPSGLIFLDVTWSPLHDSKGKIIGVASATIDLTNMKRIEIALQESEQRWATTLASVGDAVIATDLSGCIVFMNAKAEELTGWMLIETSLKPVKTVFKIMNEQTRLEVESPIDRVLKEGISCGLANHTVLVRKDGSEIPIDDSGAPIKDKEGKTTGVVLIFRDITERKKVEAALKEASEQTEFARKRLETILETSPSAVVIIEASSGKFSFVNKRAMELYGFDTLGLGLEENVAKVKARRVDGTDYPVDEMPVSRSLRFGQEVHNEEMIIQNAKGKSFPIMASTAPLRDIHGKITAAIVIWEDISERKKAEEALKENEQLYHTVFDNSQDGFQLIELIYDKNGKPIDHKFLKINHAYELIIGVKADDILDKTARYISPNVEPDWLDIPDRVAKTGLSEHVELYNKDIGKWLDCFYFRYSDSIVGTLFKDITARKKLEKQLQDSERLAAIGATAGMVGHDIRNPLQAITGDLYLAKTELASLPENAQKKNAMESLDEIQNNIDYINKIVADLQDYARPINPRAQEANIKTIFTEILAKNGIPKNIKVNMEVDNKAERVMADPDYLKRIAANLTLNAVQAMPEGGKLTIRAFADKATGDILITVKDTGIGIPEEIKPKLFTPMMTTKSKGQGFGLAVVKRMTEGLGGTVSFESVEGKGTTFSIRLPPVLRS